MKEIAASNRLLSAIIVLQIGCRSHIVPHR